MTAVGEDDDFVPSEITPEDAGLIQKSLALKLIRMKPWLASKSHGELTALKEVSLSAMNYGQKMDKYSSYIVEMKRLEVD
jgi:hypothetical protein